MGSGRTLRTRHGDDLTLEVALEDAPRALVDDEGCLAREPRVAVRLRDDPCRGVRDALVYADSVRLTLAQDKDKGREMRRTR